MPTRHTVNIYFLDADDHDGIRQLARANNAGPFDILIARNKKLWCRVDDDVFQHPPHQAPNKPPNFTSTIVILAEGDSVEWRCDEPIAVYVVPEEPPDIVHLPQGVRDNLPTTRVDGQLVIKQKPGWYPEPHPFTEAVPFRNNPGGGQAAALSGPVRREAGYTQYKAQIYVFSQRTLYDPDMFCDFPAP